MQNHVVMAFRKRMKKCGYTQISIIKHTSPNNYAVTAVEPLAGKTIKVVSHLGTMHHAFKF
jgi:hypothetical protein